MPSWGPCTRPFQLQRALCPWQLARRRARVNDDEYMHQDKGEPTNLLLILIELLPLGPEELANLTYKDDEHKK